VVGWVASWWLPGGGAMMAAQAQGKVAKEGRERE